MRPTPGNATPPPAEFIEASRTTLSGDYLPKLRKFAAVILEEDLWWRPNKASNSAGNLVLHLCGNARRWIVAGVAGAPDTRDREAEFAQRGEVSRAALT